MVLAHDSLRQDAQQGIGGKPNRNPVQYGIRWQIHQRSHEWQERRDSDRDNAFGQQKADHEHQDGSDVEELADTRDARILAQSVYKAYGRYRMECHFPGVRASAVYEELRRSRIRVDSNRTLRRNVYHCVPPVSLWAAGHGVECRT
jgi:hypothetical protein